MIAIEKKDVTIIGVFIALYCALIPLENVLAVSLGGSANKYLGICIIGLILLWKLSKPERLVFNIGSLLPILSLSLYGLISFFWTTYETNNSYLSILFNMTILTIIFVQYPISKAELDIIFISIISVGVILSFLLVTGSDFVSINNISGGRMTLIFGGLEIDNNNLAVSLFIPVICAVHYLAKLKIVSARIVLSFFLFLMMYAILVTGSRGGLLAGIVALTVYAIKNSKKISSKTILIVAVLSAIVLIIVQFLLTEGLVNRFSVADIINTGGTGRVIIWSKCINAFNNSGIFRQIFGYGFGAQAEVLHRTWGLYTAAHNDYLQILIDLGIIGEVLYLRYWNKSLKMSLNKERYVALALVILMAMSSLSIEILIKKMFWLVAYLVYVPIKNEKPNTKEF